jgi:hypothetical protein
MKKKPSTEELVKLARKLIKSRGEIPEVRIGEYSIISSTLHDPSVVSMRDSLFTGLPTCSYPEPVTIRELKGPEGTWMSDQPCELIQMHRELAVHARGNVLIGGLGLGIVARMAAAKRSVSKVTIVERQREVIDMILGTLKSPKIRVVEDDIFEYVKHPGCANHDVALLDVWQGTGEWTWQTEVVPLRRTLAGKIHSVHCWHEETMINQVAATLFRAADFPATAFHWNQCHYYAFRRGLVDLGIRTDPGILAGAADRSPEAFAAINSVEQENLRDRVLQRHIALFLTNVGSPIWESVFGKHWDEKWALRPKEEDAA